MEPAIAYLEEALVSKAYFEIRGHLVLLLVEGASTLFLFAKDVDVRHHKGNLGI